MFYDNTDRFTAALERPTFARDLASLARKYTERVLGHPPRHYSQRERETARAIAWPFLEWLDATTDHVSEHNAVSVLGDATIDEWRGMLEAWDGFDADAMNHVLYSLACLEWELWRALEIAGVDGFALRDGGDLSEMVNGYLEAQLWTTEDTNLADGTVLEDGAMCDARCSLADVAPEYVERVKYDVVSFVVAHPLAVRMYLARREYSSDCGSIASHFGHDLLLTRDHHGAGFWDRVYARSWDSDESVYHNALGDYLTECCDFREFGESADIRDALPMRPVTDESGE